MRCSAALFLALGVSTLAGGCVMLPLPPLGAQRGMEEIERLEIGSSTREDVHQALGDPVLMIGERSEIFDLSEEDLNVLVLPILMPVFGFGPVGEARHRVLADYGPGGILRGLHWEALVEDRSIPGQAPPSAPREDRDAAQAEALRQALAWEVPESWSSSVAIAPSGRSFALSHAVGEAAGRTRSLTQVRDGRTGELLQEVEYGPVGCPLLVPPSDGPLWGVAEPTAFLSDEVHLASLARDGTVCVWNPETQRGVLALDAGEGDAARLAAARAAPVLASADATGLVKVWDGISGREVASVRPCAGHPGCDDRGWSLGLALSDDGRLLATSQHGGRGHWGWDFRGAIRLWDATTGDELATITLPGEGPMFARQRLALSPDRSRLAVHLGDHVQIWRLGASLSGQAPEEGAARRSEATVEFERVLLLPLVVDQGAYRERSLGFSEDGLRLAAGEGAVVVWATDSWRQILRVVSPSPYWEFGPRFAFRADGGAIVTIRGVWELPEPSEARYAPADRPDESGRVDDDG